LRGTPCLYAGEELGLLDADIPASARIDPGGRDDSRAPIPWDGTPGHGWPARAPLPLPPEPARRNVEALAAEPDSILALYRRLLTARRSSRALTLGGCRLLDSPAGTLLYERSRDGEVARIAVNFTDAPAGEIAPGDGWRIEVATERKREGAPWNERLEPYEAVVLTRR
jgi:alpha-glucosidase